MSSTDPSEFDFAFGLSSLFQFISVHTYR